MQSSLMKVNILESFSDEIKEEHPKMDKFFTFVVILACMAGYAQSTRDWRAQRLDRFQQQYNNSKADLIFLIDVSGSLSDHGFNAEREFVSSLLSKISVQPSAARIAVITFGQNIKEDIDYIDYGYLDKNKCTFNEEFKRVVHRKEGATNINGALQKAKALLDSAQSNKFKRNHVNTVAVLLTDGGWNYGGSPYGTAKDLRDGLHYVEIFSIGVGRYLDRNQLKNIAGKEDNVIIAQDFSDFSGLATTIRGDQIESLYQTVDVSRCGITCDVNARCSCGTISGIYTCACLHGFYGSGSPGRCYECPLGTYKKYPSPDPCVPCPKFSTSRKTGSTSPADCVCFPGYTGHPEVGLPCVPKECQKLSSNLVNGQVTSCGTLYSETCLFSCNPNYHIANEAATVTTRKLTCTLDGRWDKPVPLCVSIECANPHDPPMMEVKCNGITVGSHCTFKCKPGYVLEGANERKCRSNGLWTHEMPYCRIITCPPLRKIDNVNINPLKCLSEPTNFNDACTSSCKPGFKYVSGDQTRVCLHDGTWSGKELLCLDKTPPSIRCPEPVLAESEPGRAYKEISFSLPSVIDNSISGSDDITVTQSPTSIISPHEFPIGTTLITFTAVDAAGNSDTCTFRVQIIDREPPVFTYCPEDILDTTTSAIDTYKDVSWNIPKFSDNSGSVNLTYSSHVMPHRFPVGPTQLIQYDIEDSSNNRATCEFFIKVESKTCPKRDPPINGAIGCQYVGGIGHMCSANCQNPYTFNGPLAAFYVCTMSGTWNTIPPALHGSMWPDCTAMQPQEGMGQKMKFFYYSGNCHDSYEARSRIADNFVKLLDRVMRDEGGCANAANARVCQSENVEITCGKVEMVNGRRKRSLQNSLEITVDVNIRSKESSTVQEHAVESLSEKVKNLKNVATPIANQLKVIHVDGDSLILNHIETVGQVTGVCLDGSVYDRVEKKLGQFQKSCISCVAGKYFDRLSRKCLECPKGTYTETPGRLGCTSCPLGKTTQSVGTFNATHCKAPCMPGSYSNTGLENCHLCSKGTYQPKPYSNECLRCPGSSTTLSEGAKQLEECGMICPAGTYSKTGVEPCYPCPLGFYQSLTGQKQCIQCPDSLSTHITGSTQQLECKAIDHCVSSPCMNEATCVSEWNTFRCVCKLGFIGKFCEEKKDECIDNPCYQGSTCVDGINGFTCVCQENYFGKFCSEKKPMCDLQICANNGSCYETPNGAACTCAPGFTGKYCERNIDECASSPCQNGATCLDSHRGYQCLCATGFTGALCQDNVDDCFNNACLNRGVCIDGVNKFSCSCINGYAGERCEINLNECFSSPCRNGASCIDEVNGYKCQCPPTFSGPTCEKRNTESNFDLVFDRTVQGYAESTLNDLINEFTISFWLKTLPSEIESGTVLSYAIGDNENIVDNALVLGNMNHIMLNVMGEEVPTNVSVADGAWHHVAVVWSSKNGKYKAFKDGIKVAEDENFQIGRAIPAGGVFVLGQEQDEVGRNFSASEAFDGHLSQLNIWNYVMTENEILQMSSYRYDMLAGNVIAWADFNRISADVKKEVGFCSVSKSKFHAWSSSQVSPCPGLTISAQCLTNDKKGIKELNLIGATCTTQGFFCLDSDQKKFDKNNNVVCPTQMQVRYECPFSGETDCSTNRCSGNGECIETLQGYICRCKDGFFGKNCEKELLCSSLQPFVNGFVSESNGFVTISCRPGFQLSGSNSLQCVKGKYNKEIPKCVDVNECTQSNGKCQHKCLNTEGSFICQCNEGFEMQGSTCVDVNECSINNGNCQDKCFNTYGSYSCQCRVGFKISEDQRSCQDVDECVGAHDCMQLCANTRGSYKCHCKPGFFMAKNGTCQKVPCPPLNAPINGQVSHRSGDFGLKATFTCENKYRLDGLSHTVCGADGKWSGLHPKCKKITCGTLPSPYNGQATEIGSGLGGEYKFFCLKGFFLVGSEKRICQYNGSWSGIQPRCIPYQCLPLNKPENGVVIGSSLSQGATVMIKCERGFMLSNKDSNFRTCQADGKWSNNNAQCIPVSCGRPELLANGTIVGSSFNNNDVITYRCNEGFGLSGPPQRTCLISGEWSGLSPKCLYKSCGYPGSPQFAILDGTDYSFGKSVNYSCKSGYKLIGDISRKCMLSGTWSGTQPICQEITCGDPGLPVYGVRHGDSFSVNSTVTFDCNAGYSLKGVRSIICQANGSWSNSLPYCIVGLCGSQKLVGPSGTITSPNYPNSYSSQQYCRWNIVMPLNKKAVLDVHSLKTIAPHDRLEIFDGVSQNLLTILYGAIPRSIRVTSSSNVIDAIFVTTGENSADGFTAEYVSSECGGHITSIGQVVSTPNYPSNYPNGITCTWQIMIPNNEIVLAFEQFNTDQRDELEAWNSVTSLSANAKLGAWSGNRGSFLTIESKGIMYLKFSSDEFHSNIGFKAIVKKKTGFTRAA